MSKLVTNFGDSNTTGNTFLQQNLTVQGAFSTFSGNILAGSAFSTLGNSTTKFNTVFATTANIPSVNVTQIFGTTGFVGINTTGGGATLNVAGNVWASNALSAPNVFATVSMNALTANTANIYSPIGVVGIAVNPTALGATLQIGGNVYASNAISAPNVFATISMNSAVVNTASIFGTTGFVGIGTVGSGAALSVAGNTFVSNALSTPNVFATVSMNVTGVTNTSAIFGTSGFVGIGTVGSGATLSVAGNAYVSNALSAPNVFATVSMNVTGVTNTAAIFGTSGFVGIGTVGSGATLSVAGNVFVSNAISTPNIFATLANVTTLNVSVLSGTSGTVGIGTVATGPALYVAGNLFASNAVTAPNAIVTTMNISSILNTQSIFSSTGLVGINTSTPSASLHVQGNVFASNALTAPNVFATTSMNTPTLNTTSIFGTSGFVGIGTSTALGATLHILGNVFASNTLSAPNVFATTSMNTPTLNTTSIYGSAGFVGILTSTPSATLQVQGNLFATNSISTINLYSTVMNTSYLNTASIFGYTGSLGIGGGGSAGVALVVTGNIYASNSITSPNIVTTLANITTINTGSIFGLSGLVGINTTTGGASLTVVGNIFASNAITSPNIISANANITILNTTAIFGTTGFVGIGTSTNIGSTLQIQGNLFAANALSGSNISATGTIYYGEDLFKRSPYLVANVANATTIQTWISATCNAADQTSSFWAMSGAPAYGNIASGPQGSSDYHGSVLLPDGRVLFVPRNASNVGIFNPATALFSSVSPAGLAATADKFAGGVLLPNGNVVFVPYQSANIGMYNPVALTYSNIFTVAAPSGTLFKGGVLAPNGNVIFAPQSSGNVGVFNPTLGTYANLGPLGTGATAFSGAVLLPTGNVVFVPASSANIGMYNTYSMTAATAYINIGPIPASGYDGGVLAPNGNVIFMQNTASNVGVYNPSVLLASGLSNVGPTGVGAGAFAGGCLTPSGNVVMAPYATGNVGLFDPTGLVYANVYQSTGGSTKFTGATLLPDGRVVFCPNGASNVGLLNTLVPVGPEFCLAPYFNKY